MAAGAMEDDTEELREFRARWIDDLTKRRESAVRLYNAGLALESVGQLREAVGKYREAYRLDPDVDQLVRKSAQLSLGPGAPAAPAAAATGGAAKPPISDTHDDDDGHEYRYRPHAHTAALVRAGAPAGRSEEPLVEQLARADTELQPLDPARPVPVAVLPPEVIVRVFQLVADDSLRNLARASKVCRAWYVLAQEPGVWRHICLRTWPELDPAELLRFGASWKRMFMDRPCVRTDGIYIARINYVRQGESYTSYYQPFMLITYFRYLRFFRDGTVFALLSSDEPADVVPTFSEATKDVMLGRYEARDVLDPPDGGKPYVEVRVSVRPLVGKRAGQTFHQLLRLKSTTPGASNKLSWVAYYSVPDNPEFDPTVYPLDHFKPYIFSRVKSYQPSW